MTTQQEYHLSADTVILSTADLHGNIIDYNAGFRDASGYTDSELKEKPHNILRHPDMPKEAFSDFWQTIQTGLPWFGIVKNKRKNGDHYWVAANVSPITDNGRTTGYLSVRYPATREQVIAAERLYADVKMGRVPFPYTKLKSNNTLLPIAVASSTLAIVLPMILGNLSLVDMLISGTVGILGIAYMAYHLQSSKRIQPMLQKGIESLANGRLRAKIEDNTTLGFALNMVRSRLAETDAKNYDAMRSAQVMTTALNAATTNIMIADVRFNISSMNTSLREMFLHNEAKLKSVLPNFSVNSLVGSNMDIFHKNPAHQRMMVEKLTTNFQTDLKLAGLVIRLTVTPIDLNNNRLGYVVEWLDRTIEAAIVHDVVEVSQSMKNGDFSQRINTEAEGAFLQIKTGLNEAIDNIQHVIMSISEVLEAQATGDLTKSLPSSTFKGQIHDLKNAINYSSSKVKESIILATNTSAIVNLTAEQVSAGSADLSSRVQEQASALEETSATMHQMAAAVQANTANARKVADLAHQVQNQSAEGMQVMQQTINAMQAIQDSSNQISEIVTLIDSIAFQTNLLALNAAVEAARAGEHGRGFAVVASEVRALAGKSADAAKDIKVLIENSTNRIENGTRLANKSGEMLDGISHSIEQVAGMIEEIANSSHEQSTGINQVHLGITQIDAVTQQNSALVEQTSAAAESLRSEAYNLQQNMAFFNTGDASTKQINANRQPQQKKRLLIG
jgi:methyl-accepting chemotaxis protein